LAPSVHHFHHRHSGWLAMVPNEQNRYSVTQISPLLLACTVNDASSRVLKESTIGNRSGFLFFGTMFWILNPWFNALQSCM